MKLPESIVHAANVLCFGNKIISFLIGVIVGGLLFTFLNIYQYEHVIIPNLRAENIELKSKYYDAVIQREQAKASLVKYIQDNKENEK